MGFSKVSFGEHEVKGHKYIRIFLFSFQYIPNEVSIKPSAKEDDKGNPCFVIDKLVKVILFGVFMLDTGLQGFCQVAVTTYFAENLCSKQYLNSFFSFSAFTWSATKTTNKR